MGKFSLFFFIWDHLSLLSKFLTTPLFGYSIKFMFFVLHQFCTCVFLDKTQLLPVSSWDKIEHILNFLFITSGILLSLRQVYLQRFATYDSLLCKAQELKPVYEMTLSEIFRNIYSGTSSCSEINYYFLGLSLAEWSFVIFILLLTLNIFYINKNSN